MWWLLVFPFLWLVGTGLYYFLIYAPIIGLFRGVGAKVQTMKEVKHRHTKQAWLWPFYIPRLSHLLQEAYFATKAQRSMRRK